jgi:thiamine biosynthesis lipoprotein
MPDVRAEQFRAMGSDVHLIVVDGDDADLAWARTRIDELEAHWSRFRDDSDISRLNASNGVALEVADDTLLLLQQAVEAWSLSGGAFDPTLLHALIAAGYDRSFDTLIGEGEAELPALRFDRPDVHDIEIDGRSVRFPVGLGFDPGGIGKGLAADLLVHGLVERGVGGACANMGGDLRVAGTSPDGGTWTIAVDHPQRTEPLALVGLAAGAVATSTVLKRVWTVGGHTRHHLIDPSTGRPAHTDVALATVVAGTAWQAEVLAKAALLRGVERAFDLLDDSMAGLVVDHAGRIVTSPNFARFATPVT